MGAKDLSKPLTRRPMVTRWTPVTTSLPLTAPRNSTTLFLLRKLMDRSTLLSSTRSQKYLFPSASSYKLEIDGQELSLIKNKIMVIPSKDLLSIFSVFWSSDSNVVLETPAVRVTLYNGKEAKVEDKNLLADGSQCGLCGDYNRNLVAEIKSPKGCVYSSPYAAALSYRSRKGMCGLSQEQQELINSEEIKCLK